MGTRQVWAYPTQGRLAPVTAPDPWSMTPEHALTSGRARRAERTRINDEAAAQAAAGTYPHRLGATTARVTL